MEDEISLRDLYLVLKRANRLIWGVTIAAFVLVYVVARLMPATYESEALTQALVLKPQEISQQQGEQRRGVAAVFRSAPSGQDMGLGFSKQIENQGPYVAKVIGNAAVKVKTHFDDKKNVLTIKVRARDAKAARQFTEELLGAFKLYVRDQVYASANSALEGAMEQARLDSEVQRARIEQLKKSITKVIPVKASTAAQVALESDEVPPDVARSENPALAYMSLELAKQQTNLANLEAEMSALKQLAANPDQLHRLSEQAVRVNVLSPPPLPREPVSPRPLLDALLAAVLALMATVFWAFISAALAGEEAALSEAPNPASPPEPSEAAPAQR